MTFKEPNPQWTEDEAINYECACEIIGHMKACISKEIYQEQDKPIPDTTLIEALRTKGRSLYDERRALTVKDYENNNRVRAKYGAIIRDMNKNDNAKVLDYDF